MKNKVTEAKITDLHFDDKNANKHTQKGLRLVEKSLSKLGAGRSILIDKNNNIIAGNGVIETAGQIGMENIRIVETDGKEIVAVKRTDIDINSKKGRELAIIDNHSAKESIDLDFDVINDLVTEYDISPVEWELESIDWNNNNEQEATEDNFEIPETIETNIKRGDVFNIYKDGKLLHRVMCGDSTNSDDVAKLMNGGKADMVFTDPPYNLKINSIVNTGKAIHREFKMASGEMTKDEFTKFLDTVFKQLISNSCNGSIHYICMDWRHIKELLNASEGYAELKNLCVWNKDNGGMGAFYRSKHELIFVFKNGEAKHINNFELGQYGRYRTNVWDYPSANSFAVRERIGNKCIGNADIDMHPTVKPLAMVADAILDCSNQNNIILDLFLGSGTTLIAAHQLNRRCYGMEIDEKYCQVILDRIKNLDNSIEIK